MSFRDLMQSVAHRTKSLLPHRHGVQAPPPDYATLYVGSWYFLDIKTHRDHQLTVTSDMQIEIDGQALPGHITTLNRDVLTFIDHYGFQLRIHTNQHTPVSIYDESSNLSYPIQLPTPEEPGTPPDRPDNREAND